MLGAVWRPAQLLCKPVPAPGGQQHLHLMHICGSAEPDSQQPADQASSLQPILTSAMLGVLQEQWGAGRASTPMKIPPYDRMRGVYRLLIMEVALRAKQASTSSWPEKRPLPGPKALAAALSPSCRPAGLCCASLAHSCYQRAEAHRCCLDHVKAGQLHRLLQSLLPVSVALLDAGVSGLPAYMLVLIRRRSGDKGGRQATEAYVGQPPRRCRPGTCR